MNIKINSEYITLGQFFRQADFIQGGGEAKFAVKEMDITVNGEQEDRRGRKLYAGDRLVIDGVEVIIS